VIQLYVGAKSVELLVVLFEVKSLAMGLLVTLLSEVNDVLVAVVLRLADANAFE
jgi:hypothetical protein